MYVDLNLVRAGIAATPESSEFTLAFDRIQSHIPRQQAELNQDFGVSTMENPPDAWLAPLFLDERSDASGAHCEPEEQQTADAPLTGRDPSVLTTSANSADAQRQVALKLAQGNPLGSPRASEKGFLPMTPDLYLELLDWTGRQLRADKQAAAIPAHLEPILDRIGIHPDNWVGSVHAVGLCLFSICAFFRSCFGPPSTSSLGRAHQEFGVSHVTPEVPAISATAGWVGLKAAWLGLRGSILVDISGEYGFRDAQL